ncbi:MAG: hypothetical protein NTX04_13055, partial [Verrucomicrobia bacterium]|nr:hypothetical protein [Verrucomicrobiota bacterium]
TPSFSPPPHDASHAQQPSPPFSLIAQFHHTSIREALPTSSLFACEFPCLFGGLICVSTLPLAIVTALIAPRLSWYLLQIAMQPTQRVFADPKNAGVVKWQTQRT